ncbi:MAG TPA: serine hydrolase [Gemmatimonadaceae bacterium]|nr:serine hydrolase [Gemmatimonadaceae bacterium]
MPKLLLAALLALAVPRPAADGLPVVTPESVGMSRERLALIDRVMARALDARGFPGAAVVVGRRGGIVWSKGYGHLDWSASSPAVRADETLFDLASITKVVATTTAIMVLHDEGQLGLDDRVSKYLPEFSGGGRDAVTIRHLLTHRSGLPAGRGLGGSPEAARRAVLATPLERAPGTRAIYSDLGPDLLGFVVERITREPLDRWLARRVFRPIGMRYATFAPPARWSERLAPTLEYPSRGIVHDPTARALGGVAGHAGLFATARDLAVFAQMMLDGGTLGGVRIARDSTVALFTRRAAGWRALGWDTCAGGGSCGRLMSERAFGHTGFTGTSLWIDPDREMFVIVLTNEVYAPRAPDPTAILQDVRGDIADIAALAADAADEGARSMPVLRSDRAIGWR